MSANLNDNSQSYQPFALRIFQGLKPDVVAIQEFNYLGNTPADFRSMINGAFGTNFTYFREAGAGYSIPNGIITRWPVVESGSWEDIDAGVNNRGFAWARLDIPGSRDLYVVSIHLKASSGTENSSRRAAEAAQLKTLIQSNFPPDSWLVVAGDCNTYSASEPAMATFKSYLSDTPIPTDKAAGGKAETNNGRTQRYDYVFASPSLNTNHVATRIGSSNFPSGLVFDSRVYGELTNVSPVQNTDSGLAQHMAVVRDFKISYTLTNLITVPAPKLRLVAPGVLHWTGISQLTYTVQTNRSLNNWGTAGSATSLTTNFWFTNSVTTGDANFYRVIFP